MNPLVYEIPAVLRNQWDISISDKSLDYQDIQAIEEFIPNFSQFTYELFGLTLNKAKPIESKGSDSIWAEEVMSQFVSHHEFSNLQEVINGYYFDALIGLNTAVKVLAKGLQSEELRPDGELKSLQGLRYMLSVFEKDSDQYKAIQKQGSEAKISWEEYGEKLANAGSLGFVIDSAIMAAMAAIEHQRNNEYAFDPSHLDPGDKGLGGDMDSKRRIAEITQKSKKLQSVLELAGKLKRRAAAKRAEITEYIKHQIDDVVISDDYSSVVPSEWVNPLLPVKFATGELMAYSKVGKDSKGKGSLVLILDSTGSLGGYPEIWSKAVTLVIAAICESEERDFIVLHYGNGVVKEQVFKSGEANTEALLECIDFFESDGINNEVPAFNRALEIIRDDERFADSDLVFLTDGGCDWSNSGRFDADGIKKWFSWYHDQLEDFNINAYGILIGGRVDKPDLQAITENWIQLGRSLEDDAAIDSLWGV